MNDNELYLIVLRHGDCESNGLTEHGREQIVDVAKLLKELGAKPDIIVTSTTARTRESSKILREHFNSIAAEREQHLFFERADSREEITDLLTSLPKTSKTIILSGHAETVNSFTYHVLNRRDCAKLFNMIETENYREYLSGEKEYVYTSAKTGDALILKTNKEEEQRLADVKWNLYGYIKGGKIHLAKELKEEKPLPGVRKIYKQNFPILVFKHK